MTKFIIVALAIAGTAYVLAVAAPMAYSQGFHLFGYSISFALIAFALVAMVGWRLKAK